MNNDNFIDPFPNIPNELKQLKQWVNFTLISRGNGKFGKPPTDTNGYLINKKDTGFYVDYITACKAINKKITYQKSVSKIINGICFCFTPNDNYVGVDLDNVVNNNKITGDAVKILKLLDSYTELSVSGTGIHIICKGKFEQLKNKPSFLEIFQGTKEPESLTFSGQSLKGTPDEINERTEQLQYIHDNYILEEQDKEHKGKQTLFNMPIGPLTTPNKVDSIQEHQNKPLTPATRPFNNIRPATNKTDEYYLKQGLERGKRLNSLMQGNRTTNNESDNDYFLLQELAYWSNCNADLMKRAFFYSAHYHTKDKEHQKKAQTKYLDVTIQKVIRNQRATARDRDEQSKQEYKSRLKKV